MNAAEDLVGFALELAKPLIDVVQLVRAEHGEFVNDHRQPPRATALQGHAHLRELDVAMIKKRINGKYATPNRLQDVPCRVLYSSNATAAQKQALEHYVKVRRGVVTRRCLTVLK